LFPSHRGKLKKFDFLFDISKPIGYDIRVKRQWGLDTGEIMITITIGNLIGYVGINLIAFIFAAEVVPFDRLPYLYASILASLALPFILLSIGVL